jgi:ABC-type sugar transport system ATPase subunit
VIETSLALRMERIGKAFRGVQALSEVDLAVERGEVHAIVGENGAGKSTLIKILAGVYQPDEGSIHLNGVEVTLQSPLEAKRLNSLTPSPVPMSMKKASLLLTHLMRHSAEKEVL